MTTKKTGNSKTSTVQTLGLNDLDQIVGGATTSSAPAAHPHDPSQDQAFQATLVNVSHAVSINATVLSSGQETAQAAISNVEAAAQAQHVSTTAALTDLLGATHGNQAVAAALTANLVNGTAEAELVNLATHGSLKAADVANIVQVATGTLAAYSKDGHSALGMSQNAAIDVIDSKIDTAAHAQITADHGKFAQAFESQNASQLAFSGQANSALVNQILASSGVANQLAQVAQDGTLSSKDLSALETAASTAGVSTDLTLAVAESLAQTSAVQQTLATEMTSRLASGTAEAELANLGARGSLNAADVTNIVQGVTGTLAGLSADGHSALGMSQNAAIDVIDIRIAAAANDAPATNMTNFLSAFASLNASHFAAEGSIATAEGGAYNFITGLTTHLQDGLNAAIANPLEGQGATSFGVIATVADAFSGQATSALVNQILASSAVVNQLAQVAQGSTDFSALENAAAAAHVSTDLTLAVAETVAHTSAVQVALADEMTNRLVGTSPTYLSGVPSYLTRGTGTAEGELVNLVATGSLKAADVTNIVQAVTGTLAGMSADGHSALGMSQNAAIDLIDNNINTAANAALNTYKSFSNEYYKDPQAQSNMNAFVNGPNSFGTENASQIAVGQSIASIADDSVHYSDGGLPVFAYSHSSINPGNALQAQNASVMGEIATIEAAFGGKASVALVDEIIVASNATSAATAATAISAIESSTHDEAVLQNLMNAPSYEINTLAGSVQQQGGTTLTTALENAAATAGVSSDLTLAVVDELSTTKSIQQTLDTELTTRIDNGALVGNIVNLAGQGQLNEQAAINIVSTVTGVLASHSADGNTVAGLTQAAASGIIYANIENQALAQANNSMNSGNTLIGQGNFGDAYKAYVEEGNLVDFEKALSKDEK